MGYRFNSAFFSSLVLCNIKYFFKSNGNFSFARSVQFVTWIFDHYLYHRDSKQ